MTVPVASVGCDASAFCGRGEEMFPFVLPAVDAFPVLEYPVPPLIVVDVVAEELPVVPRETVPEEVFPPVAVLAL